MHALMRLKALKCALKYALKMLISFENHIFVSEQQLVVEFNIYILFDDESIEYVSQYISAIMMSEKHVIYISIIEKDLEIYKFKHIW